MIGFPPISIRCRAAPGERRAAEARDREFDAQTFSEKSVRKFLKYPRDASFPWTLPTVSPTEDGDTFMVSGTVTAKNAFGAELTHEWGTIVSCRDGEWELLMCVIGDDVVYHADTMDEDEVVPEKTGKPAARQGYTWEIPFRHEEPPKQLAAREEEESQPLELPAWEEEESQPLEATTEEPARDRYRTWTDNTGKHTIEAEFGGYTAGNVKLKKPDGTAIEMPMGKLSKADQEWIRKRAR